MIFFAAFTYALYFPSAANACNHKESQTNVNLTPVQVSYQFILKNEANCGVNN